MAVSNKFNLMVVTTGNKSEMSVGYATLYGDMNGGYNPIKDIYKTEVFRLSRLRNAWKPPGAMGPDGVVIPENIITRPPSAELRAASLALSSTRCATSASRRHTSRKPPFDSHKRAWSNTSTTASTTIKNRI
jgi:NH3-dependent NAD+ synthetase